MLKITRIIKFWNGLQGRHMEVPIVLYIEKVFIEGDSRLAFNIVSDYSWGMKGCHDTGTEKENDVIHGYVIKFENYCKAVAAVNPGAEIQSPTIEKTNGGNILTIGSYPLQQ